MIKGEIKINQLQIGKDTREGLQIPPSAYLNLRGDFRILSGNKCKEPCVRPPAEGQHHAYMAEQLLYKMGMALMDFHKTHMLDDYAKLANYMNYPGGYPKGIPVDFYVNLFWEGLEGTQAFTVMSGNTGSFQEYERAKLAKDNLTRVCGN